MKLAGRIKLQAVNMLWAQLLQVEMYDWVVGRSSLLLGYISCRLVGRKLCFPCLCYFGNRHNKEYPRQGVFV